MLLLTHISIWKSIRTGAKHIYTSKNKDGIHNGWWSWHTRTWSKTSYTPFTSSWWWIFFVFYNNKKRTRHRTHILQMTSCLLQMIWTTKKTITAISYSALGRHQSQRNHSHIACSSHTYHTNWLNWNINPSRPMSFNTQHIVHHQIAHTNRSELLSF